MKRIARCAVTWLAVILAVAVWTSAASATNGSAVLIATASKTPTPSKAERKEFVNYLTSMKSPSLREQSIGRMLTSEFEIYNPYVDTDGALARGLFFRLLDFRNNYDAVVSQVNSVDPPIYMIGAHDSLGLALHTKQLALSDAIKGVSRGSIAIVGDRQRGIDELQSAAETFNRADFAVNQQKIRWKVTVAAKAAKLKVPVPAWVKGLGRSS